MQESKSSTEDTNETGATQRTLNVYAEKLLKECKMKVRFSILILTKLILNPKSYRKKISCINKISHYFTLFNFFSFVLLFAFFLFRKKIVLKLEVLCKKSF